MKVVRHNAFRKCNICYLLDIVDIYQFVGNGVDGESGCSVDLKLGGDVAAMGGHSVN